MALLQLFVLPLLSILSLCGMPAAKGAARSAVQRSALTLHLCPDTPRLLGSLTVEIVGDTVTTVRVPGGEETITPYKIQLTGDAFPQNTIQRVKLTNEGSDSICVEALVVDTTIICDQPTDFMESCPNSPQADALPCKQFGDYVQAVNICPEKLTTLLLTKNQINARPNQEPASTDFTPPVYDITNDMLQASSAIADGLTEGYGKVVKHYKSVKRAAIKMKPIGTIASTSSSLSSFIGALGPAFSIFSGIASIVTTFLTPNPFDELANYLSDQFKAVHSHLDEIQQDIADLGRIIEAQGSRLTMAKQLQSIRYAIRNYQNMAEKLAEGPVCGSSNFMNINEVAEFKRQYRDGKF